jgi:hypothetical protein
MEKIKWALQNDPTPLSEEHAFGLAWEGANERLFESSTLTKAEVAERRESGKDKKDMQQARLHIESVKKGHFIQKLLQRKK